MGIEPGLVLLGNNAHPEVTNSIAQNVVINSVEYYMRRLGQSMPASYNVDQQYQMSGKVLSALVREIVTFSPLPKLTPATLKNSLTDMINSRVLQLNADLKIVADTDRMVESQPDHNLRLYEMLLFDVQEYDLAKRDLQHNGWQLNTAVEVNDSAASRKQSLIEMFGDETEFHDTSPTYVNGHDFAQRLRERLEILTHVSNQVLTENFGGNMPQSAAWGKLLSEPANQMKIVQGQLLHIMMTKYANRYPAEVQPGDLDPNLCSGLLVSSSMLPRLREIILFLSEDPDLSTEVVESMCDLMPTEIDRPGKDFFEAMIQDIRTNLEKIPANAATNTINFTRYLRRSSLKLPLNPIGSFVSYKVNYADIVDPQTGQVNLANSIWEDAEQIDGYLVPSPRAMLLGMDIVNLDKPSRNELGGRLGRAIAARNERDLTQEYYRLNYPKVVAELESLNLAPEDLMETQPDQQIEKDIPKPIKTTEPLKATMHRYQGLYDLVGQTSDAKSSPDNPVIRNRKILDLLLSYKLDSKRPVEFVISQDKVSQFLRLAYVGDEVDSAMQIFKTSRYSAYMNPKDLLNALDRGMRRGNIDPTSVVKRFADIQALFSPTSLVGKFLTELEKSDSVDILNLKSLKSNNSLTLSELTLSLSLRLEQLYGYYRYVAAQAIQLHNDEVNATLLEIETRNRRVGHYKYLLSVKSSLEHSISEMDSVYLETMRNLGLAIPAEV